MAEQQIEYDDDGNPIKPPPPPPMPAMRVQRMGKKWRIVYSDTRNLARLASGELTATVKSKSS